MTTEYLSVTAINKPNLFETGFRKMVDKYWLKKEKRSELFPMTTLLGRFWDRCGFLQVASDLNDSNNILKEGLVVCEVIGKTCAVMYVSVPLVAVVDGPVVAIRFLGCTAEGFRARREQK